MDSNRQPAFHTNGNQGAAPALRYFTTDEFSCPCCGELKISMELLQMLDAARAESGLPYTVTSGYRCRRHNKELCGLPTSSHLAGLAADIAVDGDRERVMVLSGLIKAGFRRIGMARGFIHVDIDPGKHGAVWLY